MESRGRVRGVRGDSPCLPPSGMHGGQGEGKGSAWGPIIPARHAFITLALLLSSSHAASLFLVFLQGVTNFRDISYNGSLTYGELFLQVSEGKTAVFAGEGALPAGEGAAVH